MQSVLDGFLDLSRPLDRDVKLEVVTTKSPEALEVARHDAAHVMASVVQKLYPGTQVTIGPAIEDGFYYDFARETPFTPEDLEKIEQATNAAIQADLPFVRSEISMDEALRLFEGMGEQYKVEIVRDIAARGAKTLTLYRHGDWVDFCLGPHGPSTGRIGVVKLPRISNYTDFDPLEWEEDVLLKYIDTPSEIASLDLLLLPGSKSTIGDITFLRDNGFFPAIRNFTGDIAGICGGFQILGRRVSDPSGVEAAESCGAEGVGLLDVVTIMLTRKETHQATAELHTAGFQIAPRSSKRLEGYEIHMGETMLGPAARPFAHIIRRSGEELEVLDGAVTKDGRIFGTYLHGLFNNDQFRAAYLNRIRRRKGLPEREPAAQDDPFDSLAAHLEKSLDMKKLLAICGIES